MKHRRSLVPAITMAVVLSALAAEAQVAFFPDTARRLSVDGSGEASAPPDTASVTVGIYALDKNLSKARDAIDTAMAKLLDLAAKMDIPRTALVTSALNLSPEYSNEDIPTFLGYEVTRSLTVELHDLTKLEPLLNGAVNAGANRNFFVYLSSSNQDTLAQKAMKQALEDAKQKAEAAAAQLGVALGDIRSIDLNPRSNATYTAAGQSLGEGTFLPGNVTVRASASVVFLLQDTPARP